MRFYAASSRWGVRVPSLYLSPMKNIFSCVRRRNGHFSVWRSTSRTETRTDELIGPGPTSRPAKFIYMKRYLSETARGRVQRVVIFRTPHLISRQTKMVFVSGAPAGSRLSSTDSCHRIGFLMSQGSKPLTVKFQSAMSQNR